MQEPRHFRHLYTRLMSILMVVLGVAMLAVTFSDGGGPASTGILLGVLFIAAGIGRLYIQTRGR
jgi:hypothetical protein